MESLFDGHLFFLQRADPLILLRDGFLAAFFGIL